MDVERVELGPGRVVGVRERVPVDAMGDFFGRALGTVAQALGRAGVTPSGPPMALYTGDVGETVEVLAGFPVAGPTGGLADGLADGLVEEDLPEGPAVVVEHVGPYETMVDTYAALEGWMAQEELEPGPRMWEEYLNDPDAEPDPGRWRTRIVYPVL